MQSDTIVTTYSGMLKDSLILLTVIWMEDSEDQNGSCFKFATHR